MSKLTVTTDPRVPEKFKSYTPKVRKKLKKLRQLIIDEAKALPDITALEETLKWGEPSYLVKGGSTIRLDWKAKTPDTYQLYFKCTSKLVSTFKEVHGDTFEYEKTRALVFDLVSESIPEDEIRSCIGTALRYHKVKEDPFLNMKTLM